MTEQPKEGRREHQTDAPATERTAEGQERTMRPRRHPETDRHPAPGIDHEPEPDAENLIPREDGPGTL